MPCIGNDTVDVNYASTTQYGGMTIYKHQFRAFKFTPTSRCLTMIQIEKFKKYTGHTEDLEITINKNWTGFNVPENAPLIELTKKNSEISTSYGPIVIFANAILPEANVPYWIMLHSSDLNCCDTTDTDVCSIGKCIIDANKRFEATYSASDPLESQLYLNYACKNGVFRNCQWKSPGNGILAFATYKKTYAEIPSCVFTVT